MPVTAWAQNVDYESEDVGEVDLDAALALLHAFDWSGQGEYFDQLTSRGEDCCPPGVGLNDDGAVLHIYQPAKDDLEAYIAIPPDGKIMGIIPRPTQSFVIPVRSRNQAEELLRLFFEPDRERLRQHAKQVTF